MVVVVGEAPVDASPAAGDVVSLVDDAQRVHLRALEDELAWFARLLDHRLRAHFASAAEGGPPDPSEIAPPPTVAGSAWSTFVTTWSLDHVERVTVVLAMVRALKPQLLDVFFVKNATFDRRFTEFGGARTDDDFEPTGETLAFVLDGGSLEARAAAARVLDPAHRLLLHGVLAPATDARGAGVLRAPLRLSSGHLELFMSGKRSKPAVSDDLPAHCLETGLDASALVLHPGTRKQMDEILAFVAHGDRLMDDWAMSARLRPGHRALFHGPPGTGKTVSAALLGKATGRDVYRIDLSLVVSKYIGDTEKNLAKVFDRAERDGAILFFDEAEALFGKRTETRDAHDRYANQEVAYLLQRLETFRGIAVLATNVRENLDEAFTRRFESIVYFPMPSADERLRIWRGGFSARARFDDDVDLEVLARDHQLSGGSIMNVIRHVSLSAIAEDERPIRRDDLLQGVRRELQKEGRR